MRKPEIVNDRGVVFVFPGPEYDTIREDEIPHFDGALGLARTIEPPRMVIDLSHAVFFNSPFLGLLLRLRNRLSVQRNGRFGVCHVSEDCAQVIRVARLNELIDVFPTRDEAVAAYANE